MIDIKTIKDILDDDDSGKIVFAAIAILTSIKKSDIDDDIWGGMVHPDDALSRVVDLANRIYYEEEWKSEKVKIERDNKLDELGI